MDTLLFKVVTSRKATAVQKVMQNRQNVKTSLPTECLCRTAKGLYLDKNSDIPWRLLFWLGDVARLLHDLWKQKSLILSAYDFCWTICVIFVWFFRERVVKNLSLLSLSCMMLSENESVKWYHSYHQSKKESLLFSQKCKECSEYSCNDAELERIFLFC